MSDVRSKDPIAEAFERLCARDGARPLVLGPDSAATVAEVDGLACAAQALLDDARLEAGTPVGVRAADGPGFLAALLACLRAGHPAVLLEAGATADETARLFATLDLAGLLAVATASPRGAADLTWQGRPMGPGAASARPLPAGTSVIKLTSGSTGTAQGVAVSSEALLADDRTLRDAMRIGPEDRILAMIPWAHSYGLSSLVVPALAHGIPLVMPESGSPFGALAAAARCGVTVFPTVPAWAAALLNLAEPPPLPDTLRLILTAGAPLRPEIAGDFRLRFGRRIHVFYGATECGGIAYDRDGGAAERGTVGEPLTGVRVTLEPVAGGSASGGRVVVESAAVGLAILPEGSPRLGSGRFASEDLAEMSGGEIRLTARLDDLINVRGRKVNPREVERAIAQMEKVDEVVVHGVDRTPVGEPTVRAVVASRHSQVTSEAVIAWCRARLSGYKVPRSVVLVPSIPRTPRGKIDRAALERLSPPAAWPHE
ncbi:MAG TPA: class I adenylate-forming enzyme family protein [Patescibacteria group bacterium]|nr:class I adenylate-forming enzyme family protein [Patescibacteria group bacterium]